MIKDLFKSGALTGWLSGIALFFKKNICSFYSYQHLFLPHITSPPHTHTLFGPHHPAFVLIEALNKILLKYRPTERGSKLLLKLRSNLLAFLCRTPQPGDGGGGERRTDLRRDPYPAYKCLLPPPRPKSDAKSDDYGAWILR